MLGTHILFSLLNNYLISKAVSRLMRPSANALQNKIISMKISARDIHSLNLYSLLIAASSSKINVFLKDNIGRRYCNMLEKEKLNAY